MCVCVCTCVYDMVVAGSDVLFSLDKGVCVCVCVCVLLYPRSFLYTHTLTQKTQHTHTHTHTGCNEETEGEQLLQQVRIELDLLSVALDEREMDKMKGALEVPGAGLVLWDDFWQKISPLLLQQEGVCVCECVCVCMFLDMCYVPSLYVCVCV